jgi:hypothetical protein
MPASDKPYMNFIIEPDLLRRVDDFRFENRFPTRAAAIKFLLDAALTKLRPDSSKMDAAASAKVRAVKAKARKRARRGKA